MSFDLKLTGKNKIQVVINMIDDEYHGLVDGNTITLYSGKIESKGINLKEQKQILDLLANKENVIKYTSKKSFESIADIPPQDQVDIYEIAPDIGRSTDEMFDEILEQLDYTIEVLDVFHDLTGKKERLPTKQRPLSSPQSKNKVLFDTKISTLTLGKKECLIPDESLEYYVCKLVFKNRKIGAKEIDILDAAGFGQDSIRPIYDAHLRVNSKAKERLGIEKLLVYKAAKIRLNKVHQ